MPDVVNRFSLLSLAQGIDIQRVETLQQFELGFA